MSMSRFLIVGINLTNKKVLVVGAGKVGMRKIRKLINYNPQITVLSPKINETDKIFLKMNNIRIINDVYKTKYLKNFDFVIASTNSDELNLKIVNDCRKRSIFVNNVSNKNWTDVIFTVSFSIKNLIISLSTNGDNPKLLKFIRRTAKCFGLRG